MDIVSSLSSANLRDEYQNQLKLNAEGLEFTFQLYKSEVNLTKWVSSILRRLNTHVDRKYSLQSFLRFRGVNLY